MTCTRRSPFFGPSGGSACSLVAAVLLCLAAVPAVAADLDYRSIPQERYGSAYEDPRYADLYAPAPPRAPIIRHQTYGHAPVPHEPVYRYDEPRHEPRYHDPQPHRFAPRTYGYQPSPPAAPRYAERSGCTTPRAAQRALEQDGWRDFANLNLRGDIAIINARRPDGRPFELQLDRCSGDLVSARPLGHRPYGPNVYGERTAPRAF